MRELSFFSYFHNNVWGEIMGKKAFITGVTGQDGSYLAEYLLFKGYQVHGLLRRSSTPSTGRLAALETDVHKTNANLYLHYGELGDASSLTNLIYDIDPDEIYHLGAQSHVRISFDTPESTGDVTGVSSTRLLEAMRRNNSSAKFYQASSSEMFGATLPPQNEATPFYPRSPYGVAKVYAYWMAVNYREAYNLFACNGILFNHESPRRGMNFVTRKITVMLASILNGESKEIFLGNLDAKRDWGYAPDYVEAMHLILQQEHPDDYVIGTGEAHSVRDFIEKAFSYVGIEIEWRGEGVEEQGVIRSISPFAQQKADLSIGDAVIRIDPYYFRPTEVDYLLADISKAKETLDWEPRVKFSELVKIMVDYDLERIGWTPPGKGIELLRKKNFSWTKNCNAAKYL